MKILFVDDDHNMTELYRIHGKTAGFETEVCLSGVDALKYLEKNDVDIVVMDLAMPTMDGLQTAKEIRKNEKVNIRKELVKMVFWTAYDVSETIERVAKEVGVELDSEGRPKIYTKPFDLSLLVAELRRMVEVKPVIVKRENGNSNNSVLISFIGAVAIILIVSYFLYAMSRQKTEFDNVLHTEQEKWAMDWGKTKSQRDEVKRNCDQILKDKKTLEIWVGQQKLVPPAEMLANFECHYIGEGEKEGE